MCILSYIYIYSDIFIYTYMYIYVDYIYISSRQYGGIRDIFGLLSIKTF